MFCSNCGKTIRPEDEACRHCGASLGEGRFYGNAYTSSQVRLPVEALNEAPEGGMMSYTRTSYMSYDNQPEDDVYSNTTYRPLLSDEEDLDRIEAEQTAAEQAASQARAEAEAAAQAQESEPPQEEAPAAEEAAEESEPEIGGEAAAEEEPSEDVPAAEEEDELPEISTSPLPPLRKAAISPRVLSYMEELENQQQRRANGLKMPSFFKKKQPEQPAYDDELPEAEDVVAAEEYADDAYAGDEYAAEEQPAEETGDFEATGAEELSEDIGYAADEADDEADAETAFDEDGEYAADAGEYADGEDDDSEAEYYEDEDAAEYEDGAPGLLSRLKEIDLRGILQSKGLKIAVASVLIVAVIAAGVVWLNFVGTKRAKIVDVTYSVYSQGIELLQSHLTEEYRSEMAQSYQVNTSYAETAFAEDMKELDALTPETPAANDEIFITTLTIIQDAIADAIKADAEAEISGSDRTADSERDWQAISNAITTLAEATNAGQLSGIVNNLESVVAPTPTPTPAATPVAYETLSNGMMDNVNVKMMQNALINLGYLEGEPDGDFGNGTEKAVKAFQKAAGLSETGIADSATQTALFADDAPRAASGNSSAPSDPSAE